MLGRTMSHLALLGLALLLLAACSRSPAPSAGPSASEAAPAVPSEAPSAAPTVAATAVTTATPFVDTGETWFLQGLSNDGKRALLRYDKNHEPEVFRLRVVEVDTNVLVEDTLFVQLSKLPFQGPGDDQVKSVDALLRTSAFEADLVDAARVIGAFPMGALERFAVAPDGSGMAFNVGDWVYVADGKGKVGRRVADVSTYDPWFTPDAKHLFVWRINGQLDDIGSRYDIFVTPAHGAAPLHMVPRTTEMRVPLVLGDGPKAITVASHEPKVKTCVLSMDLAPPFKVVPVACIEGVKAAGYLSDAYVSFQISPHGRWVSFSTGTVREANGQREIDLMLSVVRVADGKVVYRTKEPAPVYAVGDEGQVILHPEFNRIVVLDATTGTRRALARTFQLPQGSQLRNERELVILRGERLEVVDITKEP